jgi:hypothetical protein
MITQAELRSVVSYDPETGCFRWLRTKARATAGVAAGGPNQNGYWKIAINRKRYYAHHLAFLYMTGEVPRMVDHADGDGLNNRWVNLRPCDKKTNAQNMKTPKSNTSGAKGVTWARRERKWQAQIKVDGRHINLGHFDSVDEAAQAYLNAANRHFGDFARAA